MNDKSPRQQMSKKSAKTIKEKRADRRAQGTAVDPIGDLKRKPKR